MIQARTRGWRGLCVATLLFGSLGLATHTAEAASATAPHQKRLVIIDQDALGPGGSNLQAILLLLQANDVQVLGITIVSGDGWRDEEVDHALRLLEIAGRTEVPVVPGAVMPLLNSAARTKAWEALYGKLYYKGAWTEVWPDQGVARRAAHADDPYLVPASPAGASRTLPSHAAAAKFLIDEVRHHPGEVSIIAAGPMTNLALAARMDPQWSSLARELVFMGGSFNPKAADNAFAPEYANSPRREFNMRFDPEAASLVLHEPWRKITEIPLDPTTKTLFSPQIRAQVAKGKTAFAGYVERFGDAYPMWDELAVAVWLEPSIVTRRETLAVDIDTSFTAGYGNTLSWSEGEAPHLGEKPVEVVLDIDVKKFEALVINLLTRPAGRH